MTPCAAAGALKQINKPQIKAANDNVFLIFSIFSPLLFSANARTNRLAKTYNLFSILIFSFNIAHKIRRFRR
jgi:hypothetical protein